MISMVRGTYALEAPAAEVSPDMDCVQAAAPTPYINFACSAAARASSAIFLVGSIKRSINFSLELSLSVILASILDCGSFFNPESFTSSSLACHDSMRLVHLSNAASCSTKSICPIFA